MAAKILPTLSDLVTWGDIGRFTFTGKGTSAPKKKKSNKSPANKKKKK